MLMLPRVVSLGLIEDCNSTGCSFMIVTIFYLLMSTDLISFSLLIERNKRNCPNSFEGGSLMKISATLLLEANQCVLPLFAAPFTVLIVTLQGEISVSFSTFLISTSSEYIYNKNLIPLSFSYFSDFTWVLMSTTGRYHNIYCPHIVSEYFAIPHLKPFLEAISLLKCIAVDRQ